MPNFDVFKSNQELTPAVGEKIKTLVALLQEAAPLIDQTEDDREKLRRIKEYRLSMYDLKDILDDHRLFSDAMREEFARIMKELGEKEEALKK